MIHARSSRAERDGEQDAESECDGNSHGNGHGIVGRARLGG
jgi:hypothetical protein